ncbi:AMP-binding protein [Xanthobacter dioxanivorans]|uniref:AMP-binding protein n=1 Tax=Xanthobacter dioxanivorans TaxID=2528964 RepID=A0A974PSP1_9HYPH|nr:AMP-binding protein [Xanthobacter dioxanivorans]QRG09029.1 AMP-binding protein [Xanthobacter dioxanivorans]
MGFPLPNPERAAAYRASGQWRDDTLPDLIAASVRAAPDKVAVRDASGTSLTYADLDARSQRVAGFLAASGVGRGDVVTVCLPNWCETVVVFVAVMRLGAVVNPIPVTYGRAELSFVLAKCDSRALFVPGRFRSTDFTALLAAVDPALLAGRTIVRMGEGEATIGHSRAEALTHSPLAAPPALDADDPVAVLFTSGTESRAKGAVHTHNTIRFGEQALADALRLDARDVAFMASPISHTTGFMHGVVMTLMLGGSLSLLDVFEGHAAMRQLAEHRCTWTMGATPFLVDIVAALEKTGSSLPNLRYFLCGGAPVPVPAAQRAVAAGVRVMSVYGSTESPPHTVVHPQDPADKAWTTDGRPVGNIEVRIVSPDGRDLADGEVGEEWSRGPNTFLGYLGEPELTARDLDPDGWYHSGDLARRESDGSLRVVGRIKDIIVRGGQNISVREVEDYLCAHPAVRQVVVVGMPHERLGEIGCAVVVPHPGRSLTLPELTDFLAAKGVARFKLPERLEVWPSLPSNASGKIQKFLIRKALAETPDRSQP